MALKVEKNYDPQVMENVSDITNPDFLQHKDLYLGIDIGGTNTKIGLVDNTGTVLEMISFPTQAQRSFPVFARNLSDRVKNGLLVNQSGAGLAGIGVGAPNANHLTGEIENPSNLSWGTVNIVSELGELFDVPVALINDANAAAMGEKYFGVAQGMDNFIILTLGTGLGGGLVVNGAVVSGNEGHAGEIGHVIVRPDGRQCGCGRRGCLETYVSAPGLRRTVFELLGEYTLPSELRKYSFDALQGEDITAAANNGDQIALNAFEITGEILGIKLADLAALLNPEAIILAGGLMSAGDYIMKPVIKHLEKNLLSVLKNRIKVLSSGISGGNLAILGASANIMQKIGDPAPAIADKRVIRN